MWALSHLDRCCGDDLTALITATNRSKKARYSKSDDLWVAIYYMYCCGPGAITPRTWVTEPVDHINQKDAKRRQVGRVWLLRLWFLKAWLSVFQLIPSSPRYGRIKAISSLVERILFLTHASSHKSMLKLNRV